MKFLKTACCLLAVLLLVSCNNASQTESSQAPTDTAPQKSDSSDPIVVTIDGVTRTISADKRVADEVNFDESTVRYLFREKTAKGEKARFEVDFAFSDKDSLADLPKTYDLTENPALHSIASLSFMDYEREVERSLNKRLIFNKGTITVHELSKDKIRFEFEGEVHELRNDQNKSTASGHIHVNY